MPKDIEQIFYNRLVCFNELLKTPETASYVLNVYKFYCRYILRIKATQSSSFPSLTRSSPFPSFFSRILFWFYLVLDLVCSVFCLFMRINTHVRIFLVDRNLWKRNVVKKAKVKRKRHIRSLFFFV